MRWGSSPHARTIFNYVYVCKGLAIKLHESGVYVMGIFSRGQSRISIAEPMGTQS